MADSSRRRLLWQGGLVCGTFLCIASLAQQAGIAGTTTAKAGFITSLYILIVPIIGFFRGRPVTLKLWGCVALGVAGLYLLCIHGPLSIAQGDALVLISAILFSGHILVVDHYAPHVDGILLSFLQFSWTAVFSTLGMLLFEAPTANAVISAGPSIFYAGILSGGVGYTLQIISQKNLNPTIASLCMSLESVFAALSGWMFLNQSLSLQELIGCTLMFSAIIIAQLPNRRAS